MRLQFVVCKVMQREAYLCASMSKNIVDVVLMPQGLHNEPDRLRREVQAAIDRTHDSQDRPYDATIVGYGLCSNGIVGLTAKITTVIPRAHDCITLLLGSKEKYLEYFSAHPGTYWYSAGWIENSLQPGKARYDNYYKQYVEKYGEDNAQYLMEMEQKWLTEYKWATYIDWEMPESDEYRRYTKECAEFLKWNYDELEGDAGLLQKLVDGKWNDEDFLVLKPGEKVAADVNNPGVIKAEER